MENITQKLIKLKNENLCNEKTFNVAINFLYQLSKKNMKYFERVDVLPINDTIDLHWLCDKFELLINIGDNGITSFYGDEYGDKNSICNNELDLDCLVYWVNEIIERKKS